MKSTISSKGQITVPAEIAEVDFKAGLNVCLEIFFVVVDEAEFGLEGFLVIDAVFAAVEEKTQVLKRGFDFVFEIGVGKR